MSDPDTDIKTLAAEFPIALLPVRIETRFIEGYLWIRVYPDEIAADIHEPALTNDELVAGTKYWQDAWNPPNELDAWRRLLQFASPERAAWLVRVLTPLNLSARPDSEPQFPTVPLRDRQLPLALARTLPQRWVAVAYRGGIEVARVIGEPITGPLAMSFRPDLAEGAPELESLDELSIEPELRWAVDLEAARIAGMAMRLPLSRIDALEGFDRLIVVGVRTHVPPDRSAEDLAALLDAHHYTRGLALVPQGTPTNNVGDGESGYPPPADPVRSHAIEIAPTALAPGTDAALLARALGVPASTFEHVDGAARIEQQRARAMNEALWPCTLGYFLQQLMMPLLGASNVRDAREHFGAFVRGRGPLPAIRIGRVPYGVLPATSLKAWSPSAGAPAIERKLVQLLTKWRTSYLAQRNRVARVGKTSDPDADLLEVLSLDASCREVRSREALGPAYFKSMLQLFGQLPTLGDEARANLVNAVLSEAGISGTPRIGGFTWADRALRISRALVTSEPLSEIENLTPNYIATLRTAPTMLALRNAGQKYDKSPLLFYLLRQGALLEYARIGVELAILEGDANELDRIEPELIKISPGTLGRLTHWERFQKGLLVTGTKPLGDWLLAPSSDQERADARAYRANLEVLEATPTAELERLLTETLDTCSHRIDAWITSLATRRLDQMRTIKGGYTHLGAFAWVENLRPRSAPRPGTAGGHIHAPSPAHAAAAAVLRNAHLTRTGAAREHVTVDLSSARVRRALSLLDGVRQGQPAGAVLGYRFERALHDAQLDVYIAPFRRLYPISRDPAALPEATSERIAARDVVDGLALRGAITGISPPPWNDPTKLPPVQSADRAGVAACLAALDADVDAAADLLVAESVYQAVQGNTDRAAATLATMSGNGTLPAPQIASVPRTGTGFTQRVAVALGEPPAGGPPGWTTTTPRRIAEPRLEAWAARLLGSPLDVRCRVTDGATQREIALAELGLGALDFVDLARRESSGELDARILWRARDEFGASTSLVIDHTRAPAWSLSILSFPEALEIARAICELVAVSRPLTARDLALPSGAPDPAIDERDLAARETMLSPWLAGTRSTLAAALTAAATAALPVDLDPLRDALWAAAGFGASTAPASTVGSDELARTALVDQARGVLAELDRRAAAAGAETTSLAKLTASFGGGLTILPPFTPPDPATLDVALNSLVVDPLVPRRWFERAARVRDPVGALRLVALAAEAVTPTRFEFSIAQLPHVPNAPWIALPFDRTDPEQRPRAGTCSIALCRAFSFAADGTWAGLLVDEWAEMIPSKTQLTAYAVHHDAPGAEAAQCVLLAVPPPQATWDLQLLIDIIGETLDLAVIRAVDAELSPFSLLAPCIYLSANVADETISFDAGRHLVNEVEILGPA